MKKLYLVRHAKSSWKDPSLDDIDRPLNKRGKRDAPFMGKLLRKEGVKPDLIITSPAKRAFFTAKTIANEIDYSKKDIVKSNLVYLTSTNELLEVINDISQEVKTAMLFGHNHPPHRTRVQCH